MTYTIRQMTREDIPSVQQVAGMSWNDTYAGIIPLHIQDKFLQSAYSKSALIWRLQQSHHRVATVEGRIIGFAFSSLINEHGEVELGAIYLHPDFQNKGIGSALIEVCKNEIAGLKRIFLSVEKENLSGIQFYKAKGFHKDTEYDDNFEGHVFRTVKMVLEI